MQRRKVKTVRERSECRYCRAKVDYLDYKDVDGLQKLLTHKSPIMTQRYAHLRDETLKRASNLMSELVENAISEKKKEKYINYKN